MIAVCDAFHAMTEDRVYRKAMSLEGAIAEIERCAGTQFDPTCVARPGRRDPRRPAAASRATASCGSRSAPY